MLINYFGTKLAETTQILPSRGEEVSERKRRKKRREERRIGR
jgi:hypothetical protein